MKRTLAASEALVLAAVLGIGAAEAQLNQVMRHHVNNDATNVFGCATACTFGALAPEQRCNVFRRIWADVKPTQVNLAPAPITACERDGFPRFGTTRERLFGDIVFSANYPDSNGSQSACEAWVSAWDAVLNPAAGTFISFYGVGSTLINFGETGNASCSNCRRPLEPGYETTCNAMSVSAGEDSGMCFGALGQAGRPASPAAGTVIAEGAVAADNSFNTPLGNDADADPSLDVRGGLEPVPVPRIVSQTVFDKDTTVAWDAADNQVLVNRPGGAACPEGATFPAELTMTTAPAAIAGVRLFLHKWQVVGPHRTLASLEGSSVLNGVLNVFGNAAPASSYCSTDDSGVLPGTPCPSVHLLSCSAPGISGGVCGANGIDFTPAAQLITISEAALNTAFGAEGPLGQGQAAVLNTKVVYMGSNQTYSGAGASFLNPKLVSLFSANSTGFSFESLAASVRFDDSATSVRGNRVTLSWTTVGGPFESFRLARALDGLDFQEVAVIPGGAEPTYSFTDEIRGRASASVWYRLLYRDVGGVEGQSLTKVSLRTSARR